MFMPIGVEFLHALQQVRKVTGMYSGPWTWRSSDVFLHHPRSSAALLHPPYNKLSRPSVASCMKSRHPSPRLQATIQRLLLDPQENLKVSTNYKETSPSKTAKYISEYTLHVYL